MKLIEQNRYIKSDIEGHIQAVWCLMSSLPVNILCMFCIWVDICTVIKYLQIRNKGVRGVKCFKRKYRLDLADLRITYHPNKAMTKGNNCAGGNGGETISGLFCRYIKIMIKVVELFLMCYRMPHVFQLERQGHNVLKSFCACFDSFQFLTLIYAF